MTIPLMLIRRSFTHKIKCMNRIDRVSAILIQMQSRKVVKAQEIANRFEISLRTVYRDMKTLEQAGIPVFGETGVGYSIMDGYRLPPVMFTREEATAFLTAEKLMDKFTDGSIRTSHQSGMFKIRAILRGPEKDMLENMETSIAVMRNNPGLETPPVAHTLQSLLSSIPDKRVLHIRYSTFHTDEITERDIELVGLFYSGGYWHAIAWCRLRNDYRNFRTDRIKEIWATGHTFSKKHPTLQSWLEKVAKNENLQTVVIQVTREAAKYLQQTKYYYGFVKEERFKDKIQMSFLTPCLRAFARWYIVFADEAEIISPDSLTTVLKGLVGNIHKKLG